MTDKQPNPIALITGGSRGLGRNMALRLAERGVDIIFTYRAATAQASEVREEIRALGRQAVAIPLDVTDSASFEAFVRRFPKSSRAPGSASSSTTWSTTPAPACTPASPRPLPTSWTRSTGCTSRPPSC